MHLLIVGSSRHRRMAAARERGAQPTIALDAAMLPFVRPTRALLSGATPRVIAIDDLERAFPNRQTGGARLVLTQSTYLVQKILDLLDADDRVILTAERAALARDAADALQGRGPWALFEVLNLDDEATLATTEDTENTAVKSVGEEAFSSGSSVSSVVEILAAAFRSDAANERIRLCREAIALAPDNAVAHLALASACREAGDRRAARMALDRAAALAPEWEAVHFEDGKFWLGADEMEQARAAFQRACDRMPTFSASFSNLGATLGELDQPEAALAAFHQALAHDPHGVPILNNIGVVNRELGRFDASEAALRRVVALAPSFVFGHYNLGHTLFFAGKAAEALAAYEEGQRRDPEKNRRQACRLAVMRFANGDAAGADRDLWTAVDAAPPEARDDLLLEAYEIAEAAVAQNPALNGDRRFVDRIGAAIAGGDESRR